MPKIDFQLRKGCTLRSIAWEDGLAGCFRNPDIISHTGDRCGIYGVA